MRGVNDLLSGGAGSGLMEGEAGIILFLIRVMEC